MISVDEALTCILDQVGPLEVEERPLSQSVGYTVAETIVAPSALPLFDNSAMDGYAVHVRDVAGAAPEAPVWLRLMGEAAAGTVWEKPLGPGETVRIMTGAQIPSTADAVVMLEEARLRDGRVEIRQPVAAGEHIRREGEDIIAGREALAKGTTIRIQHLGILAGLGKTHLKVTRAPTASLLTTGSELIEIGQSLQPGKIYNSNGLVLAKLLARSGIVSVDQGTVSDEPVLLREDIQRSQGTDLLVISGGVSVGTHDHVKEVLQLLGMKTHFWRVAMKPGKPILFGKLGPQWVFGLPGNPISCVVCFLLFVRPAIQKMMGLERPPFPMVRAKLRHSVTKKDNRRHYLTAQLEELPGERLVSPTSKQGSGMLAALAQANAFIVVPEERSSLEAGELIDVLPFPSD